MAGAIYKPGQGYWVRVMTACFVGVLVLATALWAAEQTNRFDPPTVGYDVPLASATGEVPSNSSVDLLDLAGDRVASGTVQWEQQGSAGKILRIGDIITAPDRDPTEAARVVASDETSDFRASIPRASIAKALAFPRVYLQGGVAGIILLLGAVIIYVYVGVKRRPVDFLINTDNEMKKVNWSTRREIVGSTWCVVAASVLISALLFAIDLFFQAIFRGVGVVDI